MEVADFLFSYLFSEKSLMYSSSTIFCLSIIGGFGKMSFGFIFGKSFEGGDGFLPIFGMELFPEQVKKPGEMAKLLFPKDEKLFEPKP